MIRILLVDDEPPVFRYMKNLVEEVDPEFKVVGEAFDGLEALERIETVMPHIIFTDIRMPVMDGLRFLDEVKKRYPLIICVILSAYTDFDYMRKAIQLNTADYLLKPVTPKALKELLVKLKGKLDLISLEEQQKYLKSLVTGRKPEKMHLEFNAGAFSVILICAGLHCKVNPDSISAGSLFWDSDNINVLLNDLKMNCDHYWIIDGEKENEKILLVKCEKDPWERSTFIIDKFQTMIQNCILPITIVYKLVVENAEGIATTVRRLRIRLMKSLMVEKSQLIDFSLPAAVNDNAIEVKDEKKLTAIFSQLTENPNWTTFEEVHKKLLELCEQAEITQIRLEMILKNVLIMIQNTMRLTQAEMLESLVQTDILISNAIGLREIFDGFKYIVKDLYDRDLSVKGKKDYHEELVSRIESYLKEHYAKPLTLQEIAGRFGMVPNYIGALFKKHRNITPGEYVCKLRINKAIELMKADPAMLLKQVSDAIGYNDALYFSRIFKKQMGKSPSDYMR